MTLQKANSIKTLLQSLHSSEEISAPLAKEHYPPLPLQQLSFIKLLSLTTDDQIPMREAFEYVVSTLSGAQFQFVFLLKRDEKGMHIYIGVVKEAQSGLSAVQEARNMEASFKGYFPGSRLKMLTEQEVQAQIIDSFQYVRYAGAVTGIPAINAAHQDKKDDFQGIDRLMNSMGNEHFTIMVMAEPMNRHVISKIVESCYELYDLLSVHQTKSVQFSENQSVTESYTETKTNTESKSRGSSRSTNHSEGFGDEISSTRNKNSSKGTSDGINKSNSTSTAKGTSDSQGKTTGEGISETLTYANRKIKEVMEYLDEYLFPKMNYGLNKGMFRTTVYLLAEERQSYSRLKQNTFSIFQGDQLLLNPLAIEDINNENIDLQSLLTSFSTPRKQVTLNPAMATLRGYIPSAHELELSTYMSVKELTVFASMPQHEVIGIPIHQGVDFGLNTDYQTVGDIRLGSLLKRGESSDYQVTIQKKLLNKHVFIAGVTGAGKTTTCQKLLVETKVPFWVIEPAKTEYRRLLNNYRPNELYLFTIGNERTAPFRFNPFELIIGESIISHVDMLKATFTAAFPMEAAMPQILEAAMYKCYERYGWSIIDDSNLYTDDQFTEDGKYFPTLNDLLEELTAVVEDYKFGNELKQNYIGSLIARVSNLTIGSKGLIFNCRKSVDLAFLLNKNVIFELEDLRAPEDKSLVMGLLLSRLHVLLKNMYSKNNKFQHITLIEEAHRLLSKVEIGDAPSKKSAVDTFTDMLAEIRKYGESLIIVDQIPNKLAPDIMKNTNTKLIHRLYAKDDQDVIGNAMMMNSEQKEFLSNLRVGEVILFNEQFKKPVHVKIEGLMNKDNDFVSLERLQQQHSFQIQQFPMSFGSLSIQCNVAIELESTLQKFYRRFCQFKGGKRKAYERWATMWADLERLAQSINCTVEQLFLGFSEFHMKETGKLALEKFKEQEMKNAIQAVWDAGTRGELEELETNRVLYNWYFY